MTDTHNYRVLILIPAYNAAVSLPELVIRLNQILENPAILVVNDGSTDNTRDVLRDLPVRVHTHATNRGKGAALQSGFDYALEKDYDFVITIDADRQHPPEEIPRFLKRTGEADLYLGTRNFSVGRMPIHRKLTNRVTSWFVSRLAGMKVNDSQCGFRMIATELIRKLDVKSSRYQFESELIIQAAKMNARIIEIPISTVYNDESSHMNNIMDTIRFIKLVWRYLWQ
jgi:glycosyltransferase involved in cell wall biosynthesis